MKRLLKKLSINKDTNIPLENKLKFLDDIIIHKTHIIQTCGKLAKYLFNNNREDEALQLMERAFSHDMSKLSNDEFYGMSKYINDLGNNNNNSQEKQEVINTHINNNKHHPEYWDDSFQMTELDIMELACDWFSRSKQFNSDPIEFLYSKQKDRFNFPEDIFDKIEEYLEILQK